MFRFRVLVLSLVVLAAGIGASAQAHGGLLDKYKQCKHDKHKVDCGPIFWRWNLPSGNGHYWYPYPCIGPPQMYSPQIPSYYRGPYLRTIDEPLR